MSEAKQPWVAAMVGTALVLGTNFGLGAFRGGQLSLFLVLAVLAVSLDLVWGFAGILSFGQSIPFGVAAYVTAKITIAAPDLGLVAIPAAVLSGSLVAFLIGQIAFRRRLSLVVIGLLTLMLSLTTETLVRQMRDITGGFNGLTGIPRLHLGRWQMDDRTQDIVIAVICILVITLVFTMVRRPLGSVLIGLRDNEIRLAALGYDTVSLKIWVFTVGGALAGLAGALYAPRTAFVSPGLFGFVFATNLVLWVLIGGRETIIGPVVGTLIINFVTAALADAWLQYWVFATGIIFIVAVLFIPRGLIPALLQVLGKPTRPAPPIELATSRGGRETRPYEQVLAIRGLTMTYGPFTAVDDLTLTMSEPLLHCLIGPNGAGKSTLLNGLCGQQAPSGGTVTLLGEDVTGRKSWQIAQHGVSRKFQAPQVIPTLTVAENLAVASWALDGSFRSLLSQRWEASLFPAAHRIIRKTGLDESLHLPAGELSHGEKQWLEIAMAMGRDCRLLVLDEPTAGLTPQESRYAATLLREIHQRYELPVVIVEHDMAFIRSVADRVTVLSRGAVLAEGSVAEIEAHPAVRAVYIGAGADR